MTKWRYDCERCGTVVRAITKVVVEIKAREHEDECAKKAARRDERADLLARQGSLF